MLINSVSSTKVSFISVLHFLNGAQVLNATCVIAQSAITQAAFMIYNIHN